MPTIDLEFRSRGSSTTLRELRNLQTGLERTTQATINLARALGVSFGEAQQFANNLGLSAQQAQQAIGALQRLREAGATGEQAFQVLNQQLSINREQFEALNTVIDQTNDRLAELRQAEEAAQSLQQLQQGFTEATNGAIALSQSLGITLTQAQRFAESLGLTAQEAAQAVQRLQELRAVGATSAQRFEVLNRELEVTTQQFDELDQAVADSSQQLNDLQLAAVALGLQQISSALIDVGRNAVSTFTDFQSSINLFSAVSGASADQLELVETTVRALGSTTANTATNIANASVTLARLGFDAEQVADILPAVNTGAIAASTSIDNVAEVLGTVVNQFNLANEGTARFNEITDALIATSNNSATTIEGLGQALSFVGGTANNAGQEVETTLAILGLLANAGVDASRAGTTLANIFTRLRSAAANLNDPTNQAARALQTLGVEVVDSRGQLLEFDQVLIDLIARLREIDPGARGLLLQDLFELEGARDFSNLLNLTQGQIEDFLDTIQNSQGAAAEAVERTTQGLTGAIAEFNSALEGLRINIGENLEGILLPIVQLATNLINGFNELNPQIQQFLVISGGFAAVVTALGSAALAAGIALRAFGVATNAAVASTALFQSGVSASTIATQAATVATTSFRTALAGLGAVINPTTVAIGTLVFRLNEAAREQAILNSETERFEGLISELDDAVNLTLSTFERFEQSTRIVGNNLDQIAQSNLDELESRLTNAQRAFDQAFRGSRFFQDRLNLENLVSDNIEEVARAFRRTELNLENVNTRFREFRENTDQISNVKLRDLEASLRNNLRVLEDLRPVETEQISRQQEFRESIDEALTVIQQFQVELQNNVEGQEALGETVETTTENLNEQANAARTAEERLSVFLQTLREDTERANNAIALAERQRFIELEQLFDQGIINQEEFEDAKLEVTIDRLRRTIEEEEETIRLLEEQARTDSANRQAINDEILQARINLSDSILELIQAERQAEEAAAVAIGQLRDNRIDAITSGLGRVRSLVNEELRLTQNIGRAGETLLENELEKLRRGLEIRIALGDEDLDPRERRSLIRELNALNISGRTNELSLINQITRRERELAGLRRFNLEGEQVLQRELAELEQQRFIIELRRSQIQARQEDIQARRDFAAAVAEVRRLQAQGAAPEQIQIALQGVLLAKESQEIALEELAIVNQLIDNQQLILDAKGKEIQLNQEIEQQELDQLERQERRQRDRLRFENLPARGTNVEFPLITPRTNIRLDKFIPEPLTDEQIQRALERPLRVEDLPLQFPLQIPPDIENLINQIPQLRELLTPPIPVDVESLPTTEPVVPTAPNLPAPRIDLPAPLNTPILPQLPEFNIPLTPLPAPPPTPSFPDEQSQRQSNLILSELRNINKNLQQPRINNNTFNNQIMRPNDRQLLSRVRTELQQIINEV